MIVELHVSDMCIHPQFYKHTALRDLASPGSPPIGGSVRRFTPQLLSLFFYLLSFFSYIWYSVSERANKL